MSKVSAAPNQEQTPQTLSPIAERMIEAVNQELKGDTFPRHKINKLSPSFPYSHRTLANRDSLGTGCKETLTIGGRVFYTKSGILEMLRRDLAKAKG